MGPSETPWSERNDGGSPADRQPAQSSQELKEESRKIRRLQIMVGKAGDDGVSAAGTLRDRSRSRSHLSGCGH